MIKTALSALLFLCVQLIYSQETSPASGGEASGSGGSASYTMGQVYYTKNTSETQGVQQASTTTWTGTMSNVWSLSENWSFAVPDVSSEVIINSGSTNYPTASASVVVKSVAMASGSTLIALDNFSGNITYKRYIGSTNWHLISSPVSGQDIDAFATAQSLASGNGNNRGLSSYDNSIPEWTYRQAGTSNSGNFILGDGKTIKLTQQENLTFTGAIETADVDVDITRSENGFNLIGNPYPSYIAVNPNSQTNNNLLTLNSADNGVLTEDTLYIWDQSLNGGDYITKNLVSPAFYIAPGQGFFVNASDNQSFRFTEDMQTHSLTDTFLKETTTRPEIILSASNGAMVKDTEIYYIEGATVGWDNGYDSSMIAIGNNSFALYTHLLSDSEGQNLAIQSLPAAGFENMVIPVGVNASAETVLTISAAALNVPEGISVYLEDKEAASFTMLSNSSNFSTTLSSNLNGIGRFYLHTTSQVLSVNAQISAQISMYTSSRDNLRIVGVQNGTGMVSIYDVLGKQVLNTSFKATGIHNIALPSHLSKGVYIVQLTTNTRRISKKINIQ